MRFIVIADTHYYATPPARDMIDGLCVPPEGLEWLRSEIESHGQGPVVLVGHAPLGFKPAYPVGTLPDGSGGRKEGCSLLEFNRRCGRVGDVTDGVMSVTTHGLDEEQFQRESLVEERANQWVAGTQADRTFAVRL